MKRLPVISTSLVMLALGLLLGAFALPVAPESPGRARLRVADADHAGRILLEVDWPQGRGDAVFTVTAGGREVFFERVGGGYGGGREMASIAVAPRSFGRMRIAVTVAQDGRTFRATATTRFRPRAAVLPDWVDTELLIGARALRFDFRHITVSNVLLNGAPAEFGMEKNIPSDQTTYSIAILATGYRAGANAITIVGVDYRGETRTWSSSVYYSADGEIALGDVFALRYGLGGSRSGPFYRVGTDPQLLVELSDDALPDGRLVKTYRAAAPGATTIVIEKKATFRDRYEVERTIPLRVTR